MRRFRAYLLIGILALTLSGGNAQAGVSCKTLLSWIGIEITRGKAPRAENSLLIRVNDRNVHFNGIRALIPLSVLGLGWMWLHSEMFPDRPVNNVQVEMPDGTLFDPNFHERKLLALLQAERLGDTENSTLLSVAQELKTGRALPARFAFGTTGLVALRNHDDTYHIRGFPQVSRLFVDVGPEAVTFYFEGERNPADDRGRALRVSVIAQNGRLRHELSTAR